MDYEQSDDMKNNPPNRSLSNDNEDNNHLVLNEKSELKESISKQEDVSETDDVLLNERTTKSFVENSNLKEINTIGREESILQYYKLLINENRDKLNINKLTSNDVLQTTNLLIEPDGQMISRSYQPEKLMSNNVIQLISELSKLQELSSKSYDLLIIVRQCKETMNKITNLSDLYSLQTSFKHLKINFPKEYHEYHLSDDAVPVLYAYLKQYLSSNWNILDDNHNQELINLFSKWQIILQDSTIGLTTDDESPSKVNMNLYDYFIWITWIPVLQEKIQKCNLSDIGGGPNFLQKWKLAIPQNLLDYILDQIFLPKIHTYVAQLDSKCDSTAVCKLLDVWKPVIEDRLERIHQK